MTSIVRCASSFRRASNSLRIPAPFAASRKSGMASARTCARRSTVTVSRSPSFRASTQSFRVSATCFVRASGKLCFSARSSKHNEDRRETGTTCNAFTMVAHRCLCRVGADRFLDSNASRAFPVSAFTTLSTAVSSSFTRNSANHARFLTSPSRLLARSSADNHASGAWSRKVAESSRS